VGEGAGLFHRFVDRIDSGAHILVLTMLCGRNYDKKISSVFNQINFQVSRTY
jgi:hypothetical protein